MARWQRHLKIAIADIFFAFDCFFFYICYITHNKITLQLTTPMKRILVLLTSLTLFASCNGTYKEVSPELSQILETRISELSAHRAEQINLSITNTPSDQREGIAFLYAYMPQHDLDTISVSMIEQTVEYAYKAREEFAWAKEVPEDIFLNDVLPYITMDETRENWRPKFYEMFAPLVANCKDMFQAVDTINKVIKDLVNVEYNTKRNKANQSPSESMEINMASCSGLSILFTDALRSVGIPSRLAGAPLWVTKEGNHTWNEIWIDNNWYFAEYYPAKLDHSWFLERCAAFEGLTAPEHQVYATSFKPVSELHFPLVWNLKDKTVHSSNVTDRYIRLHKEQKAAAEAKKNGGVAVIIKLVKKGGDATVSADRVEAEIEITDADNKVVATGKTRNANSDMNDYLTVYLPNAQEFTASFNGKKQTFKTDKNKTNEVILFQ